MPIANVALSNTFNEFRTATNDVIAQVNQLYAVTGVTPGVYGSATLVPVITVTDQGRVTNVSNVSIASVGAFNYHSGNANFQILTSNGTSFLASIGQHLGTAASVSFKDLTVTGNVTFTGNTTTISANNLVVEDNIIQIGKDNITDVIDLGFLGHYNNGANVHTGLFRDATDGAWKFFQNYPIEPGANTNINTSNASFQYANVIAHHITSNGIFYGNGSGLTTLNASNVSSGTLANARTTASSSNGASTIVTRDAAGAFAAGAVTINEFSSAQSISKVLNVQSGNYALWVNPRFSPGSYNPLTSANSAGLIFTNSASQSGNGIFLLAPWSDASAGIRISQSSHNANTIIASNTLLLAATTTVDGALTATSVSAPTLTGVAAVATVSNTATLTADNTTNATNYLTFVNAATGNQALRTDIGLSFNPSTNTLTTTTFSGAFSGSGAALTSIPNSATTASASNGASTIVTRDASGNFTANTITVTDLNSTSDITLKENVVDIENALDIITKLSGIRFTWQGTDDVSYGLSAQQVEQILPEIVKTREDGKKGINYLNIIALLIESIKSLNKEIQNLKSYK